jgi:hypothetical protein
MNFAPFQEVYNTSLVKRGNLSFRIMLYRGYSARGLIDMSKNGIAICLEDKPTNQKAILLDEHFKDEMYQEQLDEYLRILIMNDRDFYEFVNKNERCRKKIRWSKHENNSPYQPWYTFAGRPFRYVV